jgi:exodeoxyribonuclease VII small subunit
MELNKDLTYKEAAERLQALLDEMEQGEPDMDRMTAILQESSTLAAFCLERISAMEQTLEEEKKKLPE